MKFPKKRKTKPKIKAKSCKQIGCEVVTDDPSGYCPRHPIFEVLVELWRLDRERLSDCDELVLELLRRCSNIQLRFSPADLFWIRERFSPKNTGWAKTVRLLERRDSGSLALTLKY